MATKVLYYLNGPPVKLENLYKRVPVDVYVVLKCFSKTSSQSQKHLAYSNKPVDIFEPCILNANSNINYLHL